MFLHEDAGHCSILCMGLVYTCCLAAQALNAKWLNGTQSWTSLRSQMELWQVSVLQINQRSGANCSNYLLQTGHSSLLVSPWTCSKHCAHYYLTHHQVRLSVSQHDITAWPVAAFLCIVRATLVSPSGSQQQMSILQQTLLSFCIMV